MMERHESSSDRSLDVTENLIEFPIATDRYMIYVYLCYSLSRGQFVYETPIDLIIYSIIFIVLIVFTIPFLFLKKYQHIDLPVLCEAKKMHFKRSVNAPDAFSRQIDRGFDTSDVLYIRTPDSRFMERSSIFQRLVFVPAAVFAGNYPDRKGAIAQIHHDIGHTIGRDYIFEKASAFIIFDTILFYFIHGAKFNFLTAVGVWVEIIFALFIFLIITRYSRFLHAREYRADLYGYNQVGDYMIEFLRENAEIEGLFKHKSGKALFFAQIFHPTFAQRLERLTVCMPDAENCSHMKKNVKDSIFHSRLLFAAAWCNVYWAGFMTYSYSLVLLKDHPLADSAPSNFNLFLLILINVLVLIVSSVTAYNHASRWRRVLRYFERLR